MSRYATPNRATRLIFDYEEQVVVEEHWGGVRMGAQVSPLGAAQKGADGKYASGVRYWDFGDGTGCWTLRPIQEDMGRFQSRNLTGSVSTDPQSPVFLTAATGGIEDALYGVAKTVGIVADASKSFEQWKIPGMPGMTHIPLTKEAGDIFFRKGVPAGETWNRSVSSPLLAADQASIIPLDTVYRTKYAQPADQGLCLRWLVPGTPHSYPDVIMELYFGQYLLRIKGDGKAELLEYSGPTTDSLSWKLRTSFQYCKPSQVCNISHLMIINPMIGLLGQKSIFFVGSHLENARTSSRQSSMTEIRYDATPIIRGGDIDQAGVGHVTKEGIVALAIRRDLRVLWQLSLLWYVGEGVLTDQAWRVPPTSTTTGITCLPIARTPNGSTITPVIRENEGAVTFDASAGHKQPYVVFTLNAPPYGDGGYNPFYTPYLFGYKLKRPTVVQTITPGEFTTKYKSVQISGVDGRDLRQESASAVVDDPTDAYTRLRNRGRLSCKIVTTYDPPGSEEEADVVLFQGACVRPRRKRLGVYDPAEARDGTFVGRREGGFGQGAHRAYPSPEWSRYSLQIVGMFERLTVRSTRTITTLQDFAIDTTAPADPSTGLTFQPWKATDAIKEILRRAGSAEDQINIADNPIRLWPGVGTSKDDLIIDCNTSLADLAISIARNYLGAYLIWGANAGTSGQWRLLFAPAANAAAVYHFQTWAARDDAPPHLPGAYPEDTTWCEELEGYVTPPEANHVWVMTAPPLTAESDHRFGIHLFNHKSYSVPGSTETPDPDHPDYLGFEKIIVLPDPSLYGGDGEQGIARTKRAVLWTARRLFDYACHSRRVQPVRAPLVFIKDAETDRYRPLRFHDPVTYQGQSGWWVRSVSPEYQHDGQQMALYELEMTEAR